MGFLRRVVMVIVIFWLFRLISAVFLVLGVLKMPNVLVALVLVHSVVLVALVLYVTAVL
jgi:hypothetical protein